MAAVVLRQMLLNLRRLLFRIAIETHQPLAAVMALPPHHLRAWWDYFYRADKALREASKKNDGHSRRPPL